MTKKLVFEASAYRDWSVIFCQLAHIDWVGEFKKQFGWGLSDLCFVWDGNITTMYRAPEEHLMGLFKLIEKKVEQNPEFLHKVSKESYEETKDCEKFYNNVKDLDFETLSWKEFKKYFNILLEKFTQSVPKILIGVYFPQALERLPGEKEKYAEGEKALIKTRDKIDYIVAPYGNILGGIMTKAIIKRLKLQKNLARFISIEEVKHILAKEGNLEKSFFENLKENLKQRQKYFMTGGGKVWTIPLEDYLKERGWELKKHDTNVSEIKGQSCLKQDQIIRGKVKIVLNKRQFDKIENGDIIVAPMTTPEYVPILSKVKAIITNEGGITCHAAVVSREMNIPCIVGTNIATDILKDGDLVEIDTASGVVKKIK